MKEMMVLILEILSFSTRQENWKINEVSTHLTLKQAYRTVIWKWAKTEFYDGNLKAMSYNTYNVDLRHVKDFLFRPLFFLCEPLARHGSRESVAGFRSDSWSR